MTRLTMAVLALAASSVLTDAQQALAQTPAASIEQRQAAMKMNGASMKAIVPVARGDAAWNPSAVIPALERLVETAATTPAMFPRGTGPEAGVKTAALRAVWERWAEFEAASKAQGDAARAMLDAARANDEARFKGGFAALGRSCGGCHEPFRAKQ
jgi:cytochrome c556